MTRYQVRAAAIAWAVAWIITAALIAAGHFQSRDPDSQLYAGISARLATQPVERWIAPEWWGFWNSEGLYCEHPVGMFVVPAALVRAGYPPLQAAYAINALYQILSFALVTAIAASVTSRREATALGSILQILPIAFVFRVRANQEYAVLAGLLFALYATERARTRPVWSLGMIAGFAAVLLVKGVFAVMVPIVCVLWLVARLPASGSRLESRAAWGAIAVMPVVGVLIAWGYDAAYLHVTGRSFLEIYQTRQLPEAAIAGESPIVRTLYTGTWYLTRMAWYPFPWSVLAAGFAALSIARGSWLPWESGRQTRDSGPPASEDDGRRGAWFAFVSGIVLAGAFSLAHRKADRYIFPAYFLIAAAGAGPALRRFPRLARLAAWADHPWTPAVLYVTLVVLTMATNGKLPRFTFWRT